MTTDPRVRVTRWLDEAVIGLDLCPFASRVRRADAVRIALSDASTPEEAVTVTLEEARALLEQTRPEVATTLVAFTHTLASFEIFLDAAETVAFALVDAGAEGVLQVATFHPDYCFEGHATDELSHLTNRAPLPILHLLREADVTEAVARHPDPAGIPAANIARLDALGRVALQALWRRWSDDPS